MTAVPTDKNVMLRFVIARLKEASTYRGIALVLTGLGIAYRPEIGDAIMAAGMALAGLFGVLLPDTAAE